MQMLTAFKLLLPALMPSWNFFDWIAPSPRIEFAVAADARSRWSAWQEVRIHTERFSVSQALCGVFWNPRWNDTLFMISCAERLTERPSTHSVDEIFVRLANSLASLNDHGERITSGPTLDRTVGVDPGRGSSDNRRLKFRLVFVSRRDTCLEREIRYESESRVINEVLQDGHRGDASR